MTIKSFIKRLPSTTYLEVRTHDDKLIYKGDAVHYVDSLSKEDFEREIFTFFPLVDFERTPFLCIILD